MSKAHINSVRRTRLFHRPARTFPILVLLLSCAVAAVGGNEAIAVFTKRAPSAVRVGTLETVCSGTIIDSNLTIITSTEVAASLLPIEVALQNASGKWVCVTNVSVLGVHKSYDLALIQIKLPPGEKASVASIPELTPAGKLRTGTSLYVVGNVSAFEKELEISITPAILSSPSRQIAGSAFLQFDAKLSDELLGAPVYNAGSSLIGVVAGQAESVEKVSFAVPAEKLSLQDFVPLQSSKSDIAGARGYAMRAEAYLNKYWQRNDEDPREVYVVGFYLYRKALRLSPRDGNLCFQVGKLYLRLAGKEYSTTEKDRSETARVAAAYLQRAVELEGAPGVECYTLLGRAHAIAGQREAALASWLNGLEKFPASADPCAGELAAASLAAKKYPDAINFAQKALDIVANTKDHPDRDKYRSIYIEAKLRVSPETATAPRKPAEATPSTSNTVQSTDLPRNVKVGDTITIRAEAKPTPGAIYRLGKHPPGMKIEQQSGLVSWVPSALEIGKYDVEICRSKDTGGDTVLHKWLIEVQQ